MREHTDTLIDFNEPRPQVDNDKTTDIDKVDFSKLQIRQSDPKEKLIEVTDSLIPPTPLRETPGDMTGQFSLAYCGTLRESGSVFHSFKAHYYK